MSVQIRQTILKNTEVQYINKRKIQISTERYLDAIQMTPLLNQKFNLRCKVKKIRLKNLKKISVKNLNKTAILNYMMKK